jgi:acetyl-CoA C-acetyltransferase
LEALSRTFSCEVPVPEAVIVSAVRTPVGTAWKGTLADTPATELAVTVLAEAVRRSGLPAERFDDVVMAESLAGGGDVARFAAIAAGMTGVPGQAVNRHCAGSLTAVGNAAAAIRSGMESAVVAGGVESASTAPRMSWRVPGSVDAVIETWIPPSHPAAPGDGTLDMTIAVGWNTAVEAGLKRPELDAWALRSHQRAIDAIDRGAFDVEIVPVDALGKEGTRRPFAVDEHPRRDTSLERLAALRVLHPEIDGFSITAGNSSGINDAAAALALVSSDVARSGGLTPLGGVRAWAAAGVEPARTGMAVIDVIPKVLARAGLTLGDVHLWEINEAFASVPLAACRILGIDDDLVNTSGSGCSIGHPVAASGARMLTTLVHELWRRGGGIGLAAMCAGGGQAGAVVVQVG